MFYFKFYYFPVLMKLEHVKIQLQIVRLLKRYWMARKVLGTGGHSRWIQHLLDGNIFE